MEEDTYFEPQVDIDFVLKNLNHFVEFHALIDKDHKPLSYDDAKAKLERMKAEGCTALPAWK